MEVQIKFRGGGNVNSCAPLFSEGEELVYIPWKNLILCYFTKTGKKARQLEGLRDHVIGLSSSNFNETESYFACSITGEIINWNIENLSQPLKSNLPLNNIVVRKFHTTVIKGHQIHVLTWTLNDSNSKKLSVGYFNVSTRKLKEIVISSHDDKHDMNVGGINDNPFLAFVQRDELNFVKLQEEKQVYKRRIKGRTFTTVACHPSYECILTGDNTGRIVLWHALEASEATQAVFHWHTLPVNTLTFSQSGSYFFSGAEECVLIKWDIDDPQNKSFLPRMSSPIEHVVVANDNVLLAVVTRDNAVQVLDYRFEKISIIQHLVFGSNFSAGICHDRRSDALVMNGIVGHLQFYKPKQMSLMYNLDVCGLNKITRERNADINNTDVVKMAIDKNGKWIATVEKREDSNLKLELRLKFWLFNDNNQEYSLNTCVEFPHENFVNNLNFEPALNDSEMKCITVGGDSKFKIWEIANADTIYKKGSKWICCAVGHYKNLPCECLDFSSDGSLFAVSFAYTVTLWLTDSCEFKCSLSNINVKGEKVTNVKFGAWNRCQYLITTTENHVVVWNLLTLNATWICNLKTSFLAANHFSTYFAVFAEDSALYVFDPIDPCPIYTSLVLKNCNSKIVACALVPKNGILNSENGLWCSNNVLYIIDSNQELYCFETDEKEIENLSIIEDRVENKSVFKSTLPKVKSKGESEKLEVFVSDSPIRKYGDVNKIRQFLDSPIHTMAPAHLTCEKLLKLMVEKRQIIN